MKTTSRPATGFSTGFTWEMKVGSSSVYTLDNVEVLIANLWSSPRADRSGQALENKVMTFHPTK